LGCVCAVWNSPGLVVLLIDPLLLQLPDLPLPDLLPLKLSASLDHRFDDLLRQARGLQVDDLIGAEMIRQRSGVDVTDDQVLIDSTFEHFQDLARSGGKGRGGGAAGCGWY
jgi:hypothetical protein